MRDATLTDITCIEELLGELIKEKTFGEQTFAGLWRTYCNMGHGEAEIRSGMDPDERRR